LARSETVPRLCILAILLFLRRARIVIGDALLLRPLPGGTPVVVLAQSALKRRLSYAGTAATNAAAIGGRGGGPAW
jgi:hypothetical protein